jgi:hypothetical protein
VVGIDQVGAAAGMRNRRHVHQRRQGLVTGIHDGNLVGLIGRGEEVTPGAVPAAIVQEPGCIDGGFFQIVDVFVVDQLDQAGFLDVDDELGVLVRRDDGGDARLRWYSWVSTVMPRVETIFMGSSVMPSMSTYCGGQYAPAMA